MAIVTPFPTSRKPHPIRHYAYLGELYGTAELLNGSGYRALLRNMRKRANIVRQEC